MASDNQVLNTDGLNQDNRAFFSALVLALHLKSMCYSLIYIVAWHGVKTRVHFQVLTQYKHVYIYIFICQMLFLTYRDRFVKGTIDDWTSIDWKLVSSSKKQKNLRKGTRCLECFNTESMLSYCLIMLLYEQKKLELLRKQGCVYWLTGPFLIKFLFCVFFFKKCLLHPLL